VSKIVGFINFVMKYFLILLMVVLTSSVFLQVVFRFVLEQPLAWSEELARYCLVWLTFLGAAYAMSLRAHIGVTFFNDLFPLKIRRVLFIIATLASVSFFALMVFQGYNLVGQSMEQLSPVLRIPMGFIYFVIPLSGFLLIVNLLATFVQDFKTGGKIE